MPVSAIQGSIFMERIALAVCALLAFLLPIGFYCIILASINRRPRPLLVSGLWDAIGLLFAVSGFFLITMPMLFSEFFARALFIEGIESPLSLWLQHWIMYLAYFLFLICGSAFLIALRTRKTMIYNVDAEQFPKALELTLVGLGLSAQRDHQRLILFPSVAPSDAAAFMEAPPATVATDRRHAELNIESFASMCHVTLHWEKCTPSLRDQIETELNKNLESAAPLENPSASWFLNISGMIFGTLVMAVLTFVTLVFFLTWR
jgi:hypothetical protein